ncbi:MAG: ABC transporter ATP-binding protein [Chloroflexi bacterium]|nr:ABC transporter ATP-binding protein [Chloroflexota bacterium]
MSSTNIVNIFEIKNLDYRYPGNIPALRQINFNVREGELIALVGANGSGKSTLLKLLDGLIFPSSGEIRAFGTTLSEKVVDSGTFAREFHRKVGLVFQDPDVQLFSPTVWDEVTFGPLQLGIPKEEIISRGLDALQLLNIAHLKERPPYLLSGGEKKKVSLASVDFLLEWSDENKTLIFSTQDLDIVEELATRVLVIGSEHDIIADDKPEAVLSDRDFLLKANLIHEHSHRHKELIHRHEHAHDHHH